MALRVLLADESSTIKKVFQLALQDFAVEVRPVNIGVDVAMVAGSFKPDIIFADVLLQKKNGYDVCAELKGDAHLRSIPVVLMWSGFMELDEDKFQASHANAQLEKPFDVQALRKLVTELVPRTQTQRLSQFLTFPKGTVEAEKRPDFVEPAAPPSKAATTEEDFTAVPIPKMKQTEKYRLNLNAEELAPDSIAVEFDAPPAEADVDEFTMRESKKAAPAPVAKPTPASANLPPPLTARVKVPPPVVPAKAVPAPAPASAARGDEVELDMDGDADFDMERTRATIPTPKAAKPAPANVNGTSLSAEQLEKIIREQSAEVIEAVVWKVIPELAAQIIERELQKLLKERDSHPF